MDDFTKDIIEKKRIASGARHQKRGSKSRKCSLPSDRLTPRQWKERNGEVMSWNLKAPIMYDEFKKMPSDLQAQYLAGLRDKYSASMYMIASDLFHVKQASLTNFLKRRDIVMKPDGRRMTKDQKEEFRKFCYGEPEDNKEETQYENAVCDEKFVEESPMKMVSFTLNFSGEFDVNAITNSIGYMLAGRKNVEIEINCKVIE